jgi:hypothetical protein
LDAKSVGNNNDKSLNGSPMVIFFLFLNSIAPGKNSSSSNDL